ncbi:MAG: hypothetical protein HYX78_01675 [Armatimonadetes bacterium]|nr:hypothetical protein [Armatimonadota bacterium]
MAFERHDRLHSIESVICQLRDVISARVIANSSGEIEEVHVLTEANRTPKQVVRDIESALMAKLGLQLDHRKVSVAQVQGTGKKEQGRLKFSDVSISLEGSKAEATVRLKRNGCVYEGTAAGLSSTNSQMRLVATAALRAVENAGAADGTMVVEDMNTGVSLGGKNVAIVLINMVTDRADDLLTGSAVVKQDLWRAVVNATLDAVNRRATYASDEQ